MESSLTTHQLSEELDQKRGGHVRPFARHQTGTIIKTNYSGFDLEKMVPTMISDNV